MCGVEFHGGEERSIVKTVRLRFQIYLFSRISVPSWEIGFINSKETFGVEGLHSSNKTRGRNEKKTEEQISNH